MMVPLFMKTTSQKIIEPQQETTRLWEILDEEEREGG